MTTWHNGQFVDHLNLEPTERGLMLGDGVFETIAVRGGKAIWLNEHLTRMESAATELGIILSASEIRFATAAIVKRSTAASEVLRVTVTRGPTARGLATDGIKPSVVLSLHPYDASKLPPVLRLSTSRIQRSTTSPAARLKTLSYIDNIAAAREVSAFANDALMLNTDRNVACTTVANIFLLKGTELVTPARDQGLLPGITRAKLLQEAEQLNLQAKERAVKPSELFEADSIFITNSLRLAVPIAEIDGKPCGKRDISFIQKHLERMQS